MSLLVFLTHLRYADMATQMVLDAGHLVEFASPRELLAKDGLLKALVDESADKDILYAMAEGKGYSV